MKKFLSFICLLSLLLSLVTVYASAESVLDKYVVSENEGADKESVENYAYGYIGDADVDGVVSVIDSTCIQYHLAKLDELRDTNFILADTDVSGTVEITDATAIQMWAASLPVKEPVNHLLSSTDETLTHVHAYKKVDTIPAMCLDGYSVYECSCKESYKSLFVEGFGGHLWSDWEVDELPEYGYYEKSRHCERCWIFETEKEVQGNQEVMDYADSFLLHFLFSVGRFESVDELFERTDEIYQFAYVSLSMSGKCEYNQETGEYTYKCEDLDEQFLRVFGRTLNWKAHKDYDESKNAIVTYPPLGAGGPGCKIVGCIDNGDGTYEVIGHTEDSTLRLVVKETESGYVVVSYDRNWD